MSHSARVYTGSGKIAVQGHDPKEVTGTVEIYVPLPADFNMSTKPYIWDFLILSWIVDQASIDAKTDKREKKNQKVADGIQTNADTQALLDDPMTNWNDPDGNILKSLVVLANKMTVDIR